MKSLSPEEKERIVEAEASVEHQEHQEHQYLWTERQEAGHGLRSIPTGRMFAVVLVPCMPPLSRAQLTVARLLSAGLSHEEIAHRIGTTVKTVRWFIGEAGRRIPGTVKGSHKLIMWYRGATRAMLEGDGEAADPG